MQYPATKANILLAITLSVAVISLVPLVQAQSGDGGSGAAPAVDIFGVIVQSQTVLLAVMVTVTGIAIRGILAVFKTGRADFDWRKTATSLIIGFLVSLQLVITSFEHLPANATASAYMVIIIGEILTVMGVDSGAKAIGASGKVRSAIDKMTGAVPIGSGATLPTHTTAPAPYEGAPDDIPHYDPPTTGAPPGK